jgi:very-short-patch-repair endonuclease
MLTNTARHLRSRQTEAEKLVWKYLRARQLEGFKFRRQQPIDKFIVDFICLELRIIIEIDGGQHSIDKEIDAGRDNYLRNAGFKILRFWNHEVLENISGVIETIRNQCLVHPPLTPPVKGGGKESGSRQGRGKQRVLPSRKGSSRE